MVSQLKKRQACGSKRMRSSDEPLRRSATSARAHRSSTGARTLSGSGNSGLSDGSSGDSSSGDDDNEDSEEDDSLLPADRASLQDEIGRVKETIQRLEGGTADDFVLGCELLLANKQNHVTRAYASFERFKQTAIQLYEYECEQAKARYHARCEELKQEMNDEFQREIQRLKNTRDGVSVMDRRRLTRNSGGGGVNGFDQKKKRGGGLLMNGGSASISGLGVNGIGISSNSNSAVLQQIVPLSPAEEAHRLQYEEKKRLEALLSKAPVFKPLNHRVKSEEVTSDLEAIAHAVRKRSGMPLSRIMNTKSRVPCIKSTTRSQRNTSDDGSGVDEEDGSSHGEEEHQRSFRSGRRLEFNPGMLQEGDKIIVYRQPTSRECEDEEMKCAASEEDSTNSHERVLSGVITASTSTFVFLLCSNGTFETIDVSDWKAGRVRVHAAEKPRKRKR